ncbi:glycosyltransferase family A protein [uncultured Croceitalea sp.]|uniref:glycosyltransferase family A protein n=1 Tax=uncultured Croceitalea sp. TaxID=1798908 RepID=UPI003305BB18
MLTFIVPVKSKVVTSDWDRFSQLLERTLKSICNQTDSNFKVVVVCHEIPETTFCHNKLHYVLVDFEPPNPDDFDSSKSFYKAKEMDKGKKILLGVEYASKSFKTDYIMTVDSDDYVSKNISKFVNSSSGNIPGWYIKNGYVHVEGRKFLVKTFKFNYLCGSSIIVKPGLVKYFIGVNSTFYFDHRLTILDSNIALHKVPFPAGIYDIGNGENIYMSSQNVKTFSRHGNWISLKGIKRLLGRLKNYRFKFITRGLREEFNFYPVMDG